MIGCVGCLGVLGIAVVDCFPFLGIQDALTSGRHAPWADVLLVVLGLTTGPVTASLVGYLAFRYRDRLLPAIEARWRGSTSREHAAALDLGELSALVALILGLGAGAALGIAVVKVLDAVLS